MLKINRDQFAADALYSDAIKEEKKWRENQDNKHDFELIDSIIAEINELGYNFKYEADLRWRDIQDKKVIPIFGKYLLKFENTGFAEDYISIIAKKGYFESTPIVFDLYEKVKKISGIHQSVACDNAFYKIKDKQYINKYLELLKNEDDATRLPLTMTLLAKWNILEAKEYFMHHLDSHNRDLVFIAIECLSYYKNDSSITTALNHHLISDDKDIIKAIKKALKRLCE